MEVVLNFAKNKKGVWEALAKVQSNYTLHIEREEKGKINLFVRSTESGRWSVATELSDRNSDDTLDLDLLHGNVNEDCPKWLKITSQSEVTLGKIIGAVVEALDAEDEGDEEGGTDDEPGADDYEWVDLGLPSGTLWCTKNVGARSESDRGLIFMWGETEGNDVSGGTTNGREYTSAAYEALGLNAITTDLDAAHDAATVHMGEGWRMPTVNEASELFQFLRWGVQTVDGVKGILFINKTDDTKRMFMPFSTYGNGNAVSMDPTIMYYWTSKKNNSESSWALFGSSVQVICNAYARSMGTHVRAVKVK